MFLQLLLDSGILQSTYEKFRQFGMDVDKAASKDRYIDDFNPVLPNSGADSGLFRLILKGLDYSWVIPDQSASVHAE